MTYLKGSPFGCDEFESYQIKVGSISNDCVFVRRKDTRRRRESVMGR